MTNNSATGGYLTPGSTQPYPGGLTYLQFIQTLFVGLTGLPGNLVRPSWQVAPPTQPDITVDWMAFGVVLTKSDQNASIQLDEHDVSQFQRQEETTFRCQFYGPNSLSFAELVRDGLQLQQNLEALRTANMAYASVGDILNMPDLINERWVQRSLMDVVLRRQVQRTYPILPVLSASGTIHTVLGSEEYLLNWQTTEVI